MIGSNDYLVLIHFVILDFLCWDMLSVSLLLYYPLCARNTRGYHPLVGRRNERRSVKLLDKNATSAPHRISTPFSLTELIMHVLCKWAKWKNILISKFTNLKTWDVVQLEIQYQEHLCICKPLACSWVMLWARVTTLGRYPVKEKLWEHFKQRSRTLTAIMKS